jgi:nucleoside-triphosphatase
VKIAITGKPGIGKTTVVKKLISSLSGKAVGFWTEEIRRDGKRWGFTIVRTDGKRKLLASVSLHSPYRVGKYKVDVEGFEKFVVPFIKNNLKEGKIIVLDEIGKMELFSENFQRLVKEILKQQVPVIVTIPYKDIHPLVRDIRSSKGFNVFTLTFENRNRIPERILELIEDR